MYVRGTISTSFGFGPGSDDAWKEVRFRGTSPARLIRIDDDFHRYSGQPRISNIAVRIERVPQDIGPAPAR
jgi:hypothetical protein